MENVKHSNLNVNGINMHVAEIGEGPAVLFLHGFPELWYSWRHQMLYLSSKGYRAIAPDLRGYGDTDAPPSATSYTYFHIVGDLVALLDALGLEQVFLVGHDWGAIIAWWFCLFRPERIKALVNMSVAFMPRNPLIKIIEGFRAAFGDDFYMCRFQRYSWRHQMLYLSSKGYRAIAPDLRGYGDTDAPPSATSYTYFHIVGDLVALLDALGLEQVFLVGHDWGAIIAWWFCLFRPERIKALVNMSVAFMPRNPLIKIIEGFRAAFGDDFYMCRFQEPGVLEQFFAAAGTTNVVRGFLSNRDPKPLRYSEEKLVAANVETRVTLPSWLTEEDVSYYVKKFEKTGFTGGLNYYRAVDLSWELTAPWTGSKVQVPAIFIVGDLDLTNSFPGFKEYIHGEGFKKDVPNLQGVIIIEGVAHFLNQEKPEEINEHIYAFIKKF